MKSDSRLQGLMACIGDASRFRVVRVLHGGARCVTELAAEVGLSQSCTTRHLQALARQRVVLGERRGKRVVYRLCHDESSLIPLLAWALGPGSDEAPAPAEAGPRAADRPARSPDRAAKRKAPPRPSGPVREPEEARSAPTREEPRTVSSSSTPAEVANRDRVPERGSRRADLEDYLL